MKEQSFYPEKDLKIIAFLLASGEVQYSGCEIIPNGTVFCYFSPRKRVLELINAYFTGKAPQIQPKVLFEKLEEARNIIFRAKDEALIRRNLEGGRND